MLARGYLVEDSLDIACGDRFLHVAILLFIPPFCCSSVFGVGTNNPWQRFTRYMMYHAEKKRTKKGHPTQCGLTLIQASFACVY